MRSLERRAKLLKVLWITLGVIAAGFIIAVTTRSIWLWQPKKTGKPGKEQHAFAHVERKRVETRNGRIERFVTFHIGRWLPDKKVDEATYNSLREGQEFLVTYVTDPDTGIIDVRRWEVPRLSPAPGK